MKIIIQRFQKILDITSADHSIRANRLYNLEIKYEDRYERTKIIQISKYSFNDLRKFSISHQQIIQINQLDFIILKLNIDTDTKEQKR